MVEGCAEEPDSDPIPTVTADVIAEPDGYTLDAETILSPEACAECHPRHYEEWAGSMHAYASADAAFAGMSPHPYLLAEAALRALEAAAPGVDVRGALLDQMHATMADATLAALAQVQQGLQVAVELGASYRFLVYNASVWLWRIARPLVASDDGAAKLVPVLVGKNYSAHSAHIK